MKGYPGALFNTYNSTGIGIKNAATIEAPKIPDDIPVPAEAYKLHLRGASKCGKKSSTQSN